MNKTSLLELAGNLNIPRRNCIKTKEELEEAIRYPRLYGVSGWNSKAASHWPENIWSKADGRYDEKTHMGGTSKKYGDGWWHDW